MWGLRVLGWFLTIIGINMVAGILTTLGEPRRLVAVGGTFFQRKNVTLGSLGMCFFRSF